MSSRRLATAAVVLFWVTAAMSLLLCVALIARRTTWSDFVEGRSLGAARDVSDADDLVQSANVALFLAGLATVIVLSIWSLRVGRRARAAGADVSPGLCCGSWYIPYASGIVPFVQLRRIARHHGQPRGVINLWQAMLITSWVLGTTVLGLEPDDQDTFGRLSDITDRLDSQMGVSVLATIVMFVMAFAAMRSVRSLERT